MDDLNVRQLFTVKIQLKPIDITSHYESKIREAILNKYGDHCYINGFIRKHSIDIVKISNGAKIGSHLHGCLTFMVEFSALCCIPRTNTIIPCSIQKINKFGVMAHSFPIDVIIPRQLQATKDINKMENLSIGDLIHVRTLDYRIESDRLVVVGIITQVDLAKPNKIELPPSQLIFPDTVNLIVSDQPPEPADQWGMTETLIQLKKKITPYDTDGTWTKYIAPLINPHEMVDKPHGNTTSILVYNKYRTLYDPTSLYPVLTRAYFKLWEVLSETKVLEGTTGRPLKIANLAEGPGGFIQALLDFRNRQHTTEWKEDQYYAITMKKDPSHDKVMDWNYSPAKNYFDLVNKQGYHVKLSWGQTEDGNLINVDNIRSFSREIGDTKCDLITGDGGIDVSGDDDKYSRQEYLNSSLFFAEIITALSNQTIGGSFILKIYDLYYDITVQMLHLLRMYYQKMFLIKPRTSRPANSEKYVVCVGFLGCPPTMLEHLMSLLDQWIQVRNRGKHVFGFEPVSVLVTPDTDFSQSLIQFSQYNSQLQMEKINEGLGLVTTNRYKTPETRKELLDNQHILAQKWCQVYHLPYVV